jgi:hypothetical protein
MALVGFVESIGSDAVEGWAADSANYEEYVQISVILRGIEIAHVVANRFRPDLKIGGIGSGEHAFQAKLPGNLRAADLAAIHVLARVQNVTRPLRMLSKSDSPSEQGLSVGVRPPAVKEFVDADASPVFVLGAARSGTSAMTQGLLKTGRYSGCEEGHFFELAGVLTDRCEWFYKKKGDDSVRPGVLLSLIDRHVVSSRIKSIFADLARDVFRTRFWVDKTPQPAAVKYAPLFREIWPQSRFIFMCRRPLENVASRRRKFPTLTMQQLCADWVDVMRAWTSVRLQLAGAAIEVDQLVMAREPDAVASEIAAFLSLAPEEAERLKHSLRSDKPQQTGNALETIGLSTVDWSEEDQMIFMELCMPWFSELGYSTGPEYFSDLGKAAAVRKF